MVRTILTVIFTLLLCGPARAQLSPGDLHRVHAELEGVENCTRCHGGDQELVPDNCMACHGRIRIQREAARGLHSRPEYAECQNCHVEHQGRNFDLVHWKGGEKAFDHALTGFVLKEKHASVDCRQCHRAQFIRGLQLADNERLDSSRTYLGLKTTCGSCHRDEHRGDLGEECGRCHTQTAWIPASGFDHALSGFPLTGKHQPVACLKCHQLMTDRPTAADFDYRRYRGVPFANCTSCHTDTHAGKLGDKCSSCHSTEGWRLVNTANFDHGKTRYPLEGKHAAVVCAKCHQEGRSDKGLRFAACRDCHSDFHHGEFAARAAKGNCEECHSVQAFAPARFLMAQHDQTEYPLRGAHQAVPCLACHQRADSGTQKELRFDFTSTRCQGCHKDPHRGQVDKLVAADGCETCHAVNTWNTVTYDHSKSNFALEGKHVKAACNKCHADMANTNDRALVKFTGIRTDCQSCHKDIHRSQFAVDGATPCANCHTTKGWKPSTFDHAKSRFALDGAHRPVACDRCHRPATDSTGNWVTYRPLDVTCVSCHGTVNPERSKRS